jgi:hypothetical protein
MYWNAIESLRLIRDGRRSWTTPMASNLCEELYYLRPQNNRHLATAFRQGQLRHGSLSPRVSGLISHQTVGRTRTVWLWPESGHLFDGQTTRGSGQTVASMHRRRANCFNSIRSIHGAELNETARPLTYAGWGPNPLGSSRQVLRSSGPVRGPWATPEELLHQSCYGVRNGNLVGNRTSFSVSHGEDCRDVVSGSLRFTQSNLAIPSRPRRLR